MKIIKEIQKRVFPTIIALTALSVSASAAFYSVTGLSKLFAGASLQVMIMAGSLEVAKLVIASLLYQYWSQLNKILRTYLSVAAFVLVLITSAGIYGFLSAAYQETATKSGIVDKEVELLELKKGRYVETRDYLLSEKKQLDEAITSLRDGLANNVIQYKDKETGQIITTTSSSNRRALQQQLQTALEQRDEVSDKLEIATDSINSIEIQSLNTTSESDLAGELGPLKYLSELTGSPMNKIINILLLVIIFVFDPLAISLVVAANFAFDKIRPKKEEEEVESIVSKEPESPEPMVLTEDVLSKLESIIDSKVNEPKDVPEPDAEQEVMVDEDFEVSNEDDGMWTEEEMEDFRNQFTEPELPEWDETEVDEIEESEDWEEEDDDNLIELVEELKEIHEESKFEEFDEEHNLDKVLNLIIEDIEEEDGEVFDEVVKHPEVKLEELKNIEVEEEVVETKTEETTIFEEEDEDLGEDTIYDEDIKEVDPPTRINATSPYLRVGNRIIPRKER